MEKQNRSQPLKTARTALWAVVLCAAVGLTCFLGGRFSAQEPEPLPPDPVVLQNDLTEIAELATVSYHYTSMGQFENSNDFYGVKIPFTTKKFILSYSGVIKAGVDLEQATVNVGTSEVVIHLPAAKILSHEMDPDSVEVFDEKTSIFNPLHVEEFARFQADQQEAMEWTAQEQGLLAEAAKKARRSVEMLMTELVPEGYTFRIQ